MIGRGILDGCFLTGRRLLFVDFHLIQKPFFVGQNLFYLWKQGDLVKHFFVLVTAMAFTIK